MNQVGHKILVVVGETGLLGESIIKAEVGPYMKHVFPESSEFLCDNFENTSSHSQALRSSTEQEHKRQSYTSSIGRL